MPHSIGEASPAGGGTCAATVPNIAPMKPSGVQLASAIVPPGRVTRTSSAAARRWSGANIEPKTDTAASNDPSANGISSASPWQEVDADPLGRGALAAALEERGHVVDAGHVAAEAGGGDRRVAAPAGHVEHGRAGVQVRRVAQALGDGDDQGRDLGEVAARPGRLLAGLDGCRSRVGAVVMAPFPCS